MCLTAKTWAKSGQGVTEQRSQRKELIYNRTAKKRKESRCWDDSVKGQTLTRMFEKAAEKWNVTFSELKWFCKEGWAKVPLHQGCLVLVLQGHYPACFTWFTAPTHLIQWLNYLYKLCKCLLVSHSFKPGVWEEKYLNLAE